MKLRHLIVPALLVLPLLACDDGDSPGAGDGGMDAATAADGGGGDVPVVALGSCVGLVTTSELKGSIDVDQTWQGAVAVTGPVTVNAAKITIAAGTTLVMGPDASIEFGWNSNVASVFARGTVAAPIRFCGKAATAGYWNRLIVGDKVTSDSVFENVAITEGGQVKAGETNGAALVLKAPVLISGVQVAASGADGIEAIDFKDGSANLTVTGAAKVPLALDGSGAATHLPLGGSYTGNGANMIAIRFDQILAETAFKNPGVPYLQEKTVRVMEPVKVTFDKGVDYRLAVDTELEIGWNSNASTVVANGTAALPVIFGRASATAGMWKTIKIGNMVRSDSVLNYVTISGGGNGGPALDVQAAITVKNVTLDGNKTGLALDGAGFGTASTALSITHTMDVPATVDLTNAITLPKGGSYAGNSKDWILVMGGDLTGTGTLANLGVPYRLEGKPQTSLSSSLTIEAGTTFLMGPDAELEFGWNSGPSTVTAVGTAAAPIVFRGAEDVVGYWDGIIVGTMVATSSKFDYVQVSNGGKATDGGLRLLKPAVSVTNSKFSKSAGFGIFKTVGDATDYSAAPTGNTFDMNALGPVGPLP
jgi:hypothetical protein